MATATLPSIEDSRVVLHGVTWEAYGKILDALDGCHARLTYDRGTLEIMSPSSEHEDFAAAFERLIDILASESGLDHMAKGSTTFRKQASARGLEPDRCYYFANWPAVLGKKRLHLDDDPPPDLAIEIEITHPVTIDRMAIYAAFGVPEIWRFDGQKLSVWLLVDGRYEARERSPLFPAIPPEGLVAYLNRSEEEPIRAWTADFRDWVRGHLEA